MIYSQVHKIVKGLRKQAFLNNIKKLTKIAADQKKSQSAYSKWNIGGRLGQAIGQAMYGNRFKEAAKPGFTAKDLREKDIKTKVTAKSGPARNAQQTIRNNQVNKKLIDLNTLVRNNIAKGTAADLQRAQQAERKARDKAMADAIIRDQQKAANQANLWKRRIAPWDPAMIQSVSQQYPGKTANDYYGQLIANLAMNGISVDKDQLKPNSGEGTLEYRDRIAPLVNTLLSQNIPFTSKDQINKYDKWSQETGKKNFIRWMYGGTDINPAGTMPSPANLGDEDVDKAADDIKPFLAYMNNSNSGRS